VRGSNRVTRKQEDESIRMDGDRKFEFRNYNTGTREVGFSHYKQWVTSNLSAKRGQLGHGGAIGRVKAAVQA